MKRSLNAALITATALTLTACGTSTTSGTSGSGGPAPSIRGMSTISMKYALLALQAADLFDTPEDAAAAGAVTLLTPHGVGSTTTTSRMRDAYGLRLAVGQPEAVAA